MSGARRAHAAEARASSSWKVKGILVPCGATRELARRAGINPRTLRYYESVGLLPEPARSEAGYRLYGEEDERRLGFIVAARSAGFSLGEIREVLALRERGVAPCRYVAARIDAKRGELDRQLRDLARLRSELDELARLAHSLPQDPAASAGYCHILERRSDAPG